MPGRKRAASDGECEPAPPLRSVRGTRSRAAAVEEAADRVERSEEAGIRACSTRESSARGSESSAPVRSRAASSAPSSPTARRAVGVGAGSGSGSGRSRSRGASGSEAEAGGAFSVCSGAGARERVGPGARSPPARSSPLPPTPPPPTTSSRGPVTDEWAAVSEECGWASPSDCVAHKVTFAARTDAKVRAEGLGKHVQRLRAAANEFRARDANARERCDALATALRDAEARLSRAENALETSTREAERTRREAATLAARLEASQEAVRELRAALATAEERCARAEAAEREATARAERESAYVGELHAYNARLQEESARARCEADRGAAAVLQAREAAAEARGRLEAAEAARTMAEREVASIEEAVDAARARAGLAERLAAELREERDAAAAEAEAARADLAAVRVDATTAKVEAEAMASADARFGAALREEVPRLREERERALKELADVKRSRDEARRKTRELERLLKAERDAAAVAERHRRALHEAVLDLKGKVRVFCRVRPLTSGGTAKPNRTKSPAPRAARSKGRAGKRSGGGDGEEENEDEEGDDEEGKGAGGSSNPADEQDGGAGGCAADKAAGSDSGDDSGADSCDTSSVVASDDENRCNRSRAARAGGRSRVGAAGKQGGGRGGSKASGRVVGQRSAAPASPSVCEDPVFASRDASALVATGAVATPAGRAPLGVRERVEVFGGCASGTAGGSGAGSTFNSNPLDLAVGSAASRHVFEFDRVFGPASSQDDVYAELGPVVQSALDGYRVAVLAYGQTGSGKTHTMLGSERDPGVIPRAAEHVRAAAERLGKRGWRVAVRVRALEVINDDLVDLLEGDWPGKDPAKVEVVAARRDAAKGDASAPASAPAKLTLTLDARGETTVRNATVVDASGGADLQAVLAVARSRRASASTLMNVTSSRSHLVFTLWIDARDPDSGRTAEGQLCLVDLAGSERLQRSGATGERARESTAINKSLSTLGDVLAALAAKAPHVPYRNSKLTHLLSPVLAAEASKVAMLVACAPEPESAAETLCALRFAAKVNATELGAARPQTATATGTGTGTGTGNAAGAVGGGSTRTTRATAATGASSTRRITRTRT